MDNKNYKEFFAINAFLLISMIVFGVLGFGFLGMACASAAVCCCMLKTNKAAIVVSMILAFVADSLVSLSFNFMGGIIICMCAFSINIAIRSRKSLLYTVSYGCLGLFAAIMLLMAAAQMFDIKGLRLADLRAGIDAVAAEILNMISSSGMETIYTQTQMRQIVDIAVMSMVPASVILFGCIYSFICITVVKRIEKQLKSEMCSHIADFSQIKADKMCTAVMIISFLVYMIAASKSLVVCAAALCMFFLIMVFYYVCGISVFVFLIKGRSGAQKVFLYIMLAIAAFVFSPVMTLTGIFDSFANVRKIAERR